MLKPSNKIPAKSLLVAGFLFLAQGPALAVDVNQGKVLAERWCASCHVVAPGQKVASNDQAPPFASLATRPDFNADRLAFLLLKPHPNMPQLALSRSAVMDLAGYVLTLK